MTLDLSQLSDSIATAPGDLPMPQVMARYLAQRTQFRHDGTIDPLSPGPDDPVTVEATAGAELEFADATLYYTTDGSLPTEDSPSIAMTLEGADWIPLADYRTIWRATLPPFPLGTVVRYRIAGRPVAGGEPVWARDGQGFHFDPAVGTFTVFAYLVEAPQHVRGPDWVRDAVIYQIFLDRFHPGTPDGSFPPNGSARGIHGGTLRGVHAALPHIADLGFTCLWLSPVNVSPSYHRYDAMDLFKVDPALGTNDDLRALITAAHERGIRVMLDFVPSHVSRLHPAFLAAQADPATPTTRWFTFDEHPHRYRSFLNMVPAMPSINAEDGEARSALIESAVYWLRDCGADAFRLDHCIGPSGDFWVAFRAATRAAKPEVFSVGEATDTPDCLRRFRGKLDAVLDFPLARAFRHTFAQDSWSVQRFDAFLCAYELLMRDGPGLVSFLDNHDMNRFLFLAGGDTRRLKLAALCQFTLPGPPVVYYGTEIGLSQAHAIETAGQGGDANVRQDMSWDRSTWNEDLLSFYGAVIALRRDQPSARAGSRTTVHVGDHVYAYRRDQAASAPLLVACNLGPSQEAMPLPPGRWARALGTTDDVRVESGTVSLGPLTGVALLGQ